MKNLKQEMVGDIVKYNYAAAPVLKEHGIDFCCNGQRSLESACTKANVATEELENELQKVFLAEKPGDPDFQAWPLDLLADYIEKTHHRYVEKRISEIKPFLQKVVKVHGRFHPELNEIQEEFNESAGALAQHMKKEELVVFPFVRKMVQAQLNGSNPAGSKQQSLDQPIQMMLNEHEDEGERFRKIEELSSNYTPPEEACNTYRVTFALLKEFQDDLHKHIHLENNILFPAALRLEQKLSPN